MSRGVVYSLICHVLLVSLIVFGLPSWSAKHHKIEDAQVITVDIVPIKTITNLKPKTRPVVKPKKVARRPTPPPRQEKTEPEEIKPINPKSKPKVTKDRDVVSLTPKRKPEPVKKKEEPAPEPKKLPPKPVQHIKPKMKPKRKVPDSLAAIEKDLMKELEQEQVKDTFKDIEKAITSTPTKKAYNPDIPLSISEMDAIRQQFYQCWKMPIGARDFESMKAIVRISLDIQGNVLKANFKHGSRYASDSYYRAFVDSAMRAVWQCNPLAATPPVEKFDSWREIELSFTPNL